MRSFTKILALVLISSLLLISVGFSASYKDVKEDLPYFSAVSMLSALEIIKGYEDGTFGPEKDVTRAEFSVMLMRTMAVSNVGSTDPNGLSFKDLNDAAWAISDIRTAYDLGIINGMSADVFAPNEKVTYEQAIKMIVCALGYEPVALDAVGGDKTKVWPNGYMQAAMKIDLLPGITVVENQPAKRWEIARLLYNALEINIMEKSTVGGIDRFQISKDKNFLNTNLRMFYGTGEIMADDKTSAAATGQLARTGEVLIEGNDDTYLKGTISTDGIVGRVVKYYYREDNNGNRTLVYLEDKTKSSSVVDVKSDDLDSVVGNSFASGVSVKYWENKDTDRSPVELELSKTPTVILNGRAIDLSTYTTNAAISNLFMIESGEIEFLSTTGAEFDKIKITSYETYVVKTVNTSDSTIIDSYRTSGSNLISLDGSTSQVNVTIKNTSNAPLTISNISAWNVLSVKKSTATIGKDLVEVIVSTASVSGAITSLSSGEGKISIDGKAYELSKYFTNIVLTATPKVTLSVGDSGKFYLDKDGKVAAMDKSEARVNYGYIAAASAASDDTVTFKILPQGGVMQTLYGASRVRVDGSSLVGQAVIDKLKLSAKISLINVDIADRDSINVSQLVKYTQNSAGKIDTIDTVDTSAGDLTPFATNSSVDMTYDSINKEFSLGTAKFKIDSTTKIFIVPTDPSTRTTYDEYSANKTSIYFKNNSVYKVESYDVTSSFAKAIVAYAKDTDAKVTNDTPIFIIQKIVTANNSSGVAAQKVTGYLVGLGNVGASLTDFFTESSGTLSGYDVGDVIRFGKTSAGFIKDGEVESLLDVHQATMPMAEDIASAAKNSDGNPIFRATTGILLSSKDNKTEQPFDLEVTHVVPGTSETDRTGIAFTADNNTAFFTYDGSLNADSKLSNSKITLEGLASYNATKQTATPAAAELFVYGYYGNVKAVYYIKKR